MPVSRKKTKDVLAEITELMAKLSDWYRKIEMDYCPIMAGDADSLLLVFQRSDLLFELHDYHMQRLSREQILAKLANRNPPNI